MKHVPNIAAALLGLLFLVFGSNFFLNFIPMPSSPPPDSLPGQFMGVFFPTGYLAFVKVLEILSGILVAVPRTRNLGLLILCPIIVNILAFHVFIMKGATLLDPVLLVIVALATFVLWTRRSDFGRLLGCCCGNDAK